MKKSIILSLLTFMSISLSAQEPVQVDGYWYTTGYYDGGARLEKDPINNNGYSGDVVIPDVVKINGVDYNVTSIGPRAFCGCKILSVTMGKNVTTIYSHAFSYSTVASVMIGEGVQNISDYAFYACDNLASVVIGDNVYSIGRQAFQNCPSLSSAILGKNLRYIGASAFVDCKNLKDIYCLGASSPSQSGGRIIEDSKVNSLTLHVPVANSGNYNSYPWSAFGEKETMESDVLPICATPEISYASGTVSFTCATEGVEYNSSVEYVNNEFNNVSEYPAPASFKVKVVAVKKGCLPSEVAEREFALESYVDVNTGDYRQGDVNRDGKVNVGDHVTLTNIILDQAK